MDFTNKRGIIFGVANPRSIAWAISKSLSDNGAQLAFTYQNERLKDPVSKAVKDMNPIELIECDALNENQIEEVFQKVSESGPIDFVVHSIAFAQREDLGGNFSETSLDGFRTALEVSAYTLIPIVKHAAPHINKDGGSIITMSFEASNKVYPGYNIMGTAKAALENSVKQLAYEYGSKNIRVNAVSAGPLPTLAARSIPGFNDMRNIHASKSPLKRNVSHEEVANTSLFLLSDLSSGITGAVIPVDAGYGIMGL